jgi:hypothetical protein
LTNELNLKLWVKVNDFIHKSSKKVVDYCVNNDIGKLIVGDIQVKKVIKKENKKLNGLSKSTGNLGRFKMLPRVLNCTNGQRTTKEKIVTGCNSNGYRRVVLKKDRIRLQIDLHILIARTFIPNPNNLPFINHKNEDKGDNRVENLEWCDNRYNLNYSIAGKNPGLQFHKGKYDVRIYHNKKYMYLGRYFTIEEATKVRNEYIRLHNL